jgi:hypothetical protein
MLGLAACGSVSDDPIDAHDRPDSAPGDIDASGSPDSKPCIPSQLAVCGRHETGIACGVSDDNAFGGVTEWSPDFSDTTGWQATMDTWATVRFPDVTGDGRADVCGRSSAGIMCGVSNGTGFDTFTLWVTEYADTQGWDNLPSYWATLDFPDIDGDGSADVCARSSDGDFCGVSNSVNSFGTPVTWGHEFSTTNGWSSLANNWGTIQHPDLNGDGKADVCGRASTGVYCGVSTGTQFSTETNWSAYFNNAGGWDGDSHWITLQFPDVDGDGNDDVCGRDVNGVVCALSNGSNGFGAASVWEDTFTDASGWTTTSLYASIQFPDINGDGKADVCSRRNDGVACALSDGTQFLTTTRWTTRFSDSDGWNNAARYWSTIQFPDLDADGDADICGRSPAGIQCALSNGTTGFDGVFTALASFTDAENWDEDPQWTTIAFPTISTGDCATASAPTPRLRLVQRGYGF